MTFEEKVDLLRGVLTKSFQAMVDMGFVRLDECKGGFAISADKAKELSARGLGAAASIDDSSGKPVMYFDPGMDPKGLVWVATHEAVHLAQIAKGDFEPSFGYVLWKGQRFEGLDASDPNYFSKDHQPWEHEAAKIEKEIRKQIGLGSIDAALESVDH
ncbi:hypothetical protein [Marinobacterium stanieri]|uniref:Uncharacterized protein n=1 Tax=Marinobacterium stanieri TaxID=49186 RepID=A0A1N6U6W8_9GAMM|nr:hypothetical protein [Marinobacterium stanieri]SIQ61375.1 hypothetical protein SAMN05421647_106246 [Marinobacterium stanieri]